jgi:hypothetical protein
MNQPSNFDRLAGFYRWMEWVTFGPSLGWCRNFYLPGLSYCRHALILGDGDGRFTARLLGANHTVQVVAVDASSAMLDALVRRAGTRSVRISTHHADARIWQHAAASIRPPIDLIVTHFFLDCLTTTEIQSLAGRIRQASSPDAIWLVSEFAVPSTLFGCLFARPLVSALYFVFALLTGLTVRALPDHSAALRRAGFTLLDQSSRLGGLLVSQRWSSGPELRPADPPRPKPISIEMLQSC